MVTVLSWLRQRQRGFARVLLGALCAAWLQFALLPCTMAYASAGHEAGADPRGAAAHGNGAMPCHDPAPAGDEPPPADECLYCLGDAPTGCDYPSDARADQRDAGVGAQLAATAQPGWVEVLAPPHKLGHDPAWRPVESEPRAFQARFGRRLI